MDITQITFSDYSALVVEINYRRINVRRQFSASLQCLYIVMCRGTAGFCFGLFPEIALENKDSISLCGRDQVCLLSSKMKMSFPLEQELSVLAHSLLGINWSCLSSGSLSCD